MAASQTVPGTDRSIPRLVPLLAAWFVVLPAVAFAIFGLGLGNHHSTIPAQNMTTPFLDTVAARRSWYALGKDLALDQGKIKTMVGHAMQSVPSSFNSQSNRAVVLFGTEHDKLWDIVTNVLKARVTPDQWISTSQKTAGFKAAAGTVMFFVDDEVVQTFASKFPTYSDQFPVWAAQSDAMLQHTIWTALSAEELGANLQHYNPLIDELAAAAWSLPPSWRLTAQLVFGERIGPSPAPGEQKPLDDKLKVFGADTGV
ncbi:nitroreductase [Colletotrichum nymphaeae SA-01]|uniref:Nitroreductase n=1 Tax=Colletotrichum nymphaeae SA-01 TaxID=1460502 RepID=A0A135TNJ7_9PEZI|nr:nitroreductase [Colletotrichum nymphaeae SA-01]